MYVCVYVVCVGVRVCVYVGYVCVCECPCVCVCVCVELLYGRCEASGSFTAAMIVAWTFLNVESGMDL